MKVSLKFLFFLVIMTLVSAAFSAINEMFGWVSVGYLLAYILHLNLYLKQEGVGESRPAEEWNVEL